MTQSWPPRTLSRRHRHSLMLRMTTLEQYASARSSLHTSASKSPLATSHTPASPRRAFRLASSRPSIWPGPGLRSARTSQRYGRICRKSREGHGPLLLDYRLELVQQAALAGAAAASQSFAGESDLQRPEGRRELVRECEYSSFLFPDTS